MRERVGVSGGIDEGVVVFEDDVTERATAIGDDDRFAWSFAGARRLKGISSDVKLFRARRAGTESR